MNQSIGTPIRVTANGAANSTACNLSALTVTAKGADVNVQFTNGVGGDVLWEVEADASGGSHTVSFPSPIYFSAGVYVVIDQPKNIVSVCVAIV